MHHKKLFSVRGILTKCTFLFFLCNAVEGYTQGVRFHGDLSPAEGLIKSQERPYRQEICLNGKWDFQPVNIPSGWIADKGLAPDLAKPIPEKWESVKIKIPSPWNVNTWGGGSKVGKGTNSPYAPGSVYYPSYPSSWENVRMGWLKRDFTVPAEWKSKRIMLHFEAVAGDCTVYVNGKEAHHQFDAYLPFDIDVTSLIDRAHPNELLIGVKDRRLFNKKDPQYKYFSATYPPGSNTSNLIGVWQDVYLQAMPELRVTSVFVKPYVEKNELQIDVVINNDGLTAKKVQIKGSVKEWLDKASADRISSPEIKWTLGGEKLTLNGEEITLKPGESRLITISTKVDGKLKLWNPGSPNLYTIVLDLQSDGSTVDRKTERFGWRSFTVHGKDFYLNGTKVQCYGDLSHPFGPYICSRRFAWAWYKMIKDAGGNSVRPHAQPWPRVYYDLADEMGIMVLDEVALFGSSIQMNFEDETFWKRAAEHTDNLIKRDRNHPSVIGWSVGNEMFAIALLNKPSQEVSNSWNTRVAQLAKRPPLLDPTRTFITSDGDEDLSGRMPVYSKHYGHGLRLDILPKVEKPIVIGESGGTYYARPNQLFQFVGDKAYGSYYNRNEALGIDLYQNAAKMARPYLSWFSPSEVCWFGIEHLNLGYHDFSRLPDLNDGIFPAEAYQEGKPGYQYERIPPYVTTFNPGLDPELPLYKPLPMFEAYKAAIAANGPLPSQWDHFQDTTSRKLTLPKNTNSSVKFFGPVNGFGFGLLDTLGLNVNGKNDSLFAVIEADNLTADQFKNMQPDIARLKKNGGSILILMADHVPDFFPGDLIPGSIKLNDRKSTALQPDLNSELGKYFDRRSLYFSEMDGDRNILKKEIDGSVLSKSSTVLAAAATDWSLFNNVDETKKCAQVVLYEHLQKTKGVGLISYKLGKCTIYICSLDYKIVNARTIRFWDSLSTAMGLKTNDKNIKDKSNSKKHDLLLDGPVN